MLLCSLSPVTVDFFLEIFSLLKNHKDQVSVLFYFILNKKTHRKSSGFVYERQNDWTENRAVLSFTLSGFFFSLNPRLFRTHVSMCVCVSLSLD